MQSRATTPSDIKDTIYCFCDPCECKPCKGTKEPPPSFPELDPYNREIICDCTDCTCEHCIGVKVEKPTYPEPTLVCECSPCACTPPCKLRKEPESEQDKSCTCHGTTSKICTCANCTCEKCAIKELTQPGKCKFAFAFQPKHGTFIL